MTTPAPPRRLEDISRPDLARLGREYMLFGHLYDRALMPQVALRLGMDEIVPLGINEWMGASPIYTRRMKRLMRVDGDDVIAICKILQLDVGFPHQYMDVGYSIIDASHAEFWLDHCGALMDVEPQGPKMVIDMCHHIEDPTFDATAVATNPRARIRPLHRPPRVPTDRAPHCHWKLTIEPDVEPLVEDPLTLAVGALPLASVANERVEGDARGDGTQGWPDYSGSFDPTFSLEHLSQGALVAVLREFALQPQLLSASAELHLSGRHDPATVREVIAEQWGAASWVAAERIAACLGIDGGGIDAVLAVLAVHPAFPPGVTLEIERVDDRRAVVRVVVDTTLDDREAPGWLGLIARGDTHALEGIVQAVDRRGAVTETAPRTFTIDVDPSREPVEEPQSVALTRISTAADWTFQDPEPQPVVLRR